MPQHGAVARPVRGKLFGANDDQISQPDENGRDRHQHQQGPQSARNVHSFQGSDDGIEKIGQKDGEQQGHHDVRGHIEKRENNSQGDNALGRVGSRRDFDFFHLHKSAHFTLAYRRTPGNCGLPRAARLR